jgi:hypothetical protein
MEDGGQPGKPALLRRILLFGSALLSVAVMAAIGPWTIYVLRAPGLHGGGVLALGAMCGLTVIGLVNLYRSRKGKSPLVSAGEALGFVFIVLAGSWAMGMGFVEALMPLLTAPDVMASSQSGWSESIIPNLPLWAMGPRAEPWSSGFYQGVEKGTVIPWTLWMRPALVWSLFAVAVTLLAVGVSGIMGRRWIEHDRLTFPNMEILGGMARGFMANRIFWIGVAVAAVIPVWNILQRFAPVFQKISTYLTGDQFGVEWMAGVGKIAFPIDFGLVGILFFVQRDIIISVVLFYFALAFEGYFLSLGGVNFTNNDAYYFSAMPIDWQMGGALLAFVGVSLWKSRQYLGGKVMAAIQGTREPNTWVSSRTSFILLAAGLAGCAIFMAALGLKGVGLPAFLLAQTASFLGISRVVAESGLAANANVDPSSMVVALTGSHLLGPTGAVALVLCFFAAATGGCMLILTTHAEKMNAESKLPRGTLAMAVLAVAVGVSVTMVSTAMLAYGQGAITFYSTWTYTWHPRMMYDVATAQIAADSGPDLVRLAWMGGGAVLMAILMVLRNNVVGWFLHPIGFLAGHQSLGVPGGYPSTPWVFIGLAAWGIKGVLLKMGGVESYEKAKPFFGGLVLGSILPNLLNIAINMLAGPPRI